MTESERQEAIRKWSEAPSVNPRYKGATPAEVARALLGNRPVTPERKVAEPGRAVKRNV